mgnify:CR=1 FL=1
MLRIAFPFSSRHILAGIVVLFGSGLLLADARRQEAKPHGALTVIYVGADDCGPCRVWRRDARPDFLGSHAFQNIKYREVIASRLYDLLAESQWPADLSFLREKVRARPGAPQWFVIQDGHLIAQEAGLSAWRRAVWPVIQTQATPPHAG